jgi:hypothetical protein
MLTRPRLATDCATTQIRGRESFIDIVFAFHFAEIHTKVKSPKGAILPKFGLNLPLSYSSNLLSDRSSQTDPDGSKVALVARS